MIFTNLKSEYVHYKYNAEVYLFYVILNYFIYFNAKTTLEIQT